MNEVQALIGKNIKEVIFFEERTINQELVYIFSVRSGKHLKERVRRFFKNLKERDQFLISYTDNFNKREDFKKERKINDLKRKEDFKNKLQVGSILECSWGYEQTNVDFYIVKSFNKNKTKIEIQELGHIEVEGGGCAFSGYVMPNPDQFISDPIIRGITGDRIKIDTSVSLHIWNGKKCYKSSYY